MVCPWDEGGSRRLYGTSKSDLWRNGRNQSEGEARRHKADSFSNVESAVFLRLVTSASRVLADLCTSPSPDGDSPAGEQYEVFKQVHHKRPHMRNDSKWLTKKGKFKKVQAFFPQYVCLSTFLFNSRSCANFAKLRWAYTSDDNIL